MSSDFQSQFGNEINQYRALNIAEKSLDSSLMMKPDSMTNHRYRKPSSHQT
jgi:hypothetical protein